MAATLPGYLLRDPQLLDVIDEEWARETLPDDGACGLGIAALPRASRP